MTGEQFEAIMQGREVGDASSTSMFDGFEDGRKNRRPPKNNGHGELYKEITLVSNRYQGDFEPI